MSESEEHRGLVTLMACKLRVRYPAIVMETDLQMKPGEPVPPVINGHRPDIYAYAKDSKFYIIGEAKTVASLSSKYTHAQIASFVVHLQNKPQGTFVLGVSGEKANGAKTLLRFLGKELDLAKINLQVFDSYDFWMLDKKEGVRWDLI